MIIAPLSVAQVAPGVYRYLEGTTTRLHDCPDPWHQESVSVVKYDAATSVQRMQSWAYSIQAHAENKTLDEWRSELRHPIHGENVSHPECHEIIAVRDDPWAREWAPIIQEVVSDYNNIRYGKTPFHKNYLGDSEYTRLWGQLFTGAVRLEDQHRGEVVISWMESLKDASDATGRALERLITQRIRDVDGPVTHTIKNRALILERVWRKMDHRFRSKSVLKYRSRWHEYTWSETWYVSLYQ